MTCSQRYPTDIKAVSKYKATPLFIVSVYFSFVYFVAVFSLCASLYFLDEYSSKEPTVYPGKSQECAGLGGGFQIVLVRYPPFYLCHQYLAISKELFIGIS